MNTPICDFINKYAKKDTARLHMPGHKGVSFLGCEKMDITEIRGADELYDAEGIIAESEANAGNFLVSGKPFTVRRVLPSASEPCCSLLCREQNEQREDLWFWQREMPIRHSCIAVP